MQGTKLKIYCERGAFTKWVKSLHKRADVEVICFPYDRGDRLFIRKKGITRARPSLVTADTTELLWSDDIEIGDTVPSKMFNEVEKILNLRRTEADTRHLDSAYKSGAKFFISEDKNFAKNAEMIFQRLGLVCIDPQVSLDREKVEKFLGI